jgi:hypothetical protein
MVVVVVVVVVMGDCRSAVGGALLTPRAGGTSNGRIW